ncbi:MAG: NifU N-terminal domain-containing protein [Rubellimicrobium sp.]|nr:NifU N-terminal domain-containing protein [Rubellimicrobium sp.]
MFIETQATSDPATLKFLPGRMILSAGTFEATTPQAASESALAARIFAVSGVARVVLGTDWIAVTRNAGPWEHLKPAVLGAIMEHFLSGDAALDGRSAEPELFSAVPVPGESGTIAALREALRGVIDPELGFNILDIGLIYGVSVDAQGAVQVTMTTTTPGCPATAYLKNGASEAALSVPGVTSAGVELTYDPRWGPERMSAIAKAHFGIPEGEGW